jgi:hypothetical protein
MTEVKPEPSKRKVWLIVGSSIAAVAIVLVGVSIALANGPVSVPGAGGPSSSATKSPSATPTPTETPGTETSTPSDGPAPSPTFDPKFGEDVIDEADAGVADFGNGITAQLVSVTDTTVSGTGIGETSGNGAKVVLTITNSSGQQISLDTVTVNAYIGADESPASPVSSDPSADPFDGPLATGQSSTGTYLFNVGSSDSSSLVVTVSLGADSALVVFGR